MAQLAIDGKLRRDVVAPDGSFARREELMLAFRVSVNGAAPITAGFSGPHVLSAIVSSVLRDPGREAPTGEALPERELEFSLGGLDTAVREHVEWATLELGVGDKVVVEVVDLGSVDPPASRRGGKGGTGEPARPAKAAKAVKTTKPAKPRSGAKRATARPAPVQRAPSKKGGGKSKRRPRKTEVILAPCLSTLRQLWERPAQEDRSTL